MTSNKQSRSGNGRCSPAELNLLSPAVVCILLVACGWGYVTPQDVKSIGMDVLRHRVAITYEAEAEEKPAKRSSRKSLMNCLCREENQTVLIAKNRATLK